MFCGKGSCSGDVWRRFRKRTRELEWFGNRHKSESNVWD